MMYNLISILKILRHLISTSDSILSLHLGQNIQFSVKIPIGNSKSESPINDSPEDWDFESILDSLNRE